MSMIVFPTEGEVLGLLPCAEFVVSRVRKEVWTAGGREEGRRGGEEEKAPRRGEAPTPPLEEEDEGASSLASISLPTILPPSLLSL